MLTIAIPTTTERKELFDKLIERVCSMAPEGVKVIYCEDNKEMSVGAKRQLLLNNIDTEYFTMLDDDDDLPDNYFDLVLPVLANKPDFVGGYELVMPKNIRVKHSLRCITWGENPLRRTPFYKMPMRTDIAKKVGFKDMRYGEDRRFSEAVYPLLKKEAFIDAALYIYNQPKPMNRQEHNKRYGI